MPLGSPTGVFSSLLSPPPTPSPIPSSSLFLFANSLPTLSLFLHLRSTRLPAHCPIRPLIRRLLSFNSPQRSLPSILRELSTFTLFYTTWVSPLALQHIQIRNISTQKKEFVAVSSKSLVLPTLYVAASCGLLGKDKTSHIIKINNTPRTFLYTSSRTRNLTNPLVPASSPSPIQHLIRTILPTTIHNGRAGFKGPSFRRPSPLTPFSLC